MTLPPLTILLGSGASVGFGFPDTDTITRTILNLEQPTLRSSRPPFATTPTMLLLKRALLGSYDGINFEMVLHAIETLATLSKVEAATPDTLRPAFSAFCDISPRWEELLNYDALQTLALYALQAIVTDVKRASLAFGGESAAKVGTFFDAIASRYL